jgi:hypothetical protein
LTKKQAYRYERQRLGNTTLTSVSHNSRVCTIDPTSQLLVGTCSGVAETVAQTLSRFGVRALRYAAERGIRIIPLSLGQRYRDASAALRRLGVDVDAWPVPPAGLFVVEERSVYLRSASPLTIAHEFSHALDCALGDGVYLSGYDTRVRVAFTAAREFITPYAAAGLDEYFAESLRAYVEVNDTYSLWPAATRERLLAIDFPMHTYVQSLFDTVF